MNPQWPSKKPRGKYPPDWPEIAQQIKATADWTCIRCGHPHDLNAGYTPHSASPHTGDKSNCAWWNLAPLCQRCHLTIQARVWLDRPWIFEHTEWMKPYVAGFFAFKYLGMDLSREVEASLEWFVTLETRALTVHDDRARERADGPPLARSSAILAVLQTRNAETLVTSGAL